MTNREKLIERMSEVLDKEKLEVWSNKELADYFETYFDICNNGTCPLEMFCDGIKEADYDLGGYHSCSDIVQRWLLEA